MPEQGEQRAQGREEGRFLITESAYGRGVRPRIEIRLDADGTYEPLGVWLERNFPDDDGNNVFLTLRDLGLPSEHAAWYADQRDKAQEETIAALSLDAPAGLVASEEAHRRTKQEAAAAFVAAMKRKEKKK